MKNFDTSLKSIKTNGSASVFTFAFNKSIGHYEQIIITIYGKKIILNKLGSIFRLYRATLLPCCRRAFKYNVYRSF